MKRKHFGRRRFLKQGATLAGLAVGGIRSVSGQELEHQHGAAPSRSDGEVIRSKDTRAYGERSRFVTSLRIPDDPSDRSPVYWTPLQDSIGIITPSSLHYISDHYNLPEIDPRQHRLMIHGLVDRPLIFTMEELMRFPSVARVHFLECPANSSPSKGELLNARTVQQTHGRTACSEWTGVPLALLLREAGVQAGASWLVAEGADSSKYTYSIPLAKALEDVLVAYGQNGEPVRPENGFPLRLLVPGFKATSSVKWLRRLQVVDQAYATNVVLPFSGR